MSDDGVREDGVREDVAVSLGRLYEVAFNTGALTTLSRIDKADAIVDEYRADMRRWKLGSAVDRMLRDAGVVDPGFEKVARHAAEYLYTKGYISGLLFIEEYLDRIKSTPGTKVEALHFGCDFDGENNFGQWMGDGGKTARERLLEKMLSRDLEDWKTRRWKGEGSKGEFLQSDCLLFLKLGTAKTRYHMLSVDFSAFSGGALLRSDIAEPESQRRALARELYSLRSKSVFSGLYLDTGRPGSASADELNSTAQIPAGLKDYMGAFKYRDKEVVKMVQAGSYAHSFYEALLEEGYLSETDSVRFTAIGHTDRDSVSISVSERERAVLRTCHDIYKNHDTRRQLPENRRKVLNLIAKNASTAFVDGKQFVKNILDLPKSTLSAPGNGVLIEHEEQLGGFTRPQEAPGGELLSRLGLPEGMELRNAHSRLVREALSAKSDALYVFLTGSPGIGKTTSIVSYLAAHEDEGFLFVYVSPRKHVNRDIVAKFAREDLPDDLLCINSNREVVEEGDSGPTVEFRAAGKLRDELNSRREIGGVRFLDEVRPGAASRGSLDKTTRQDSGTITDKSRGGVGVLYSVFGGLNAAIENGMSRRLVATAAVQALKQTRSGDTLAHLPEIFRSALNNGEPIPEKMRELSGRVKNIFFMVDEITGDPAGAEFLSKLGKELARLGLTDGTHGFNAKIVVADASIVDRGIIEQHLSEAASEPDKIFFRTAADDAREPLSIERFDYRGKHPAVVVNANCYPAGKLDVSYKVRCEASPFSESSMPEQRDLRQAALDGIADDVAAFLKAPEEHPGQTIVYIQDKARLANLIGLVRSRLEMSDEGMGFEKPGDYIEIHAKLSQPEERSVEKYKDSAKVVFMTSSASRGLSFERARRILVEIPRFSLEQNLMELIQVVYRGRGCDEVDGAGKRIGFYISESVLYDPRGGDRDDAVRDGAMNLLTFLLVLKTSLMTRIHGSGRIGGNEFLMVPVGGKNVSFAGESYSGDISSFLGSLSSEIRRDPQRGHSLRQDVYEPIESMFGSGIYGVSGSPWIGAAEKFRPAFIDRSGRGLESLLDNPPLDGAAAASPASAVGSLLVVPYDGGEDGLEEEYALREAQRMGYATIRKLRDRLWAMSHDDGYPKDLKHKCRAPLDVLEEILEVMNGKSQQFRQSTSRPDRYYALPLSLYVFGGQLEEYLRMANTGRSQYPREYERGGLSFRNLLEDCLRGHFPLDGVLPIGAEYGGFPFLIFNSYNLKELRGKLFAENQMLASNELNVLGLILAKSE